MNESIDVATQPELLRGLSLSKSYGSVVGVRNASFHLRQGEVLGLVGDNGAGKSSLIRMLSGALSATSGSLLVGGEEVQMGDPLHARRLGIETVHQDLALAPNMTVAENIFLGREIVRSGPFRFSGWLDAKEMRRRANADLADLSINLPSSRALCQDLSGGQRQAVAIARALSFRPKVLLLDEPTAALGVRESRKVLELVKRVKRQGIGVILVSHNMQDIHDLCDRVLVLFRGEIVAELGRENRDVNEIVRWITGAAIDDSFQPNLDNMHREVRR